MEYKRHSSLKKRNLLRSTSLKKKEASKTSAGLDFKEKQVCFTSRDRQNHTHVIGSTGTGKSKFLEYMIRQDLLNRKAGFCLIDPHGSLYDEILIYASHKYPRLYERIVLFNPAQDSDFVLGFNPIPAVNDNADYVLEMLISACLKAWGQDSIDRTPRITRWLENIFYALMCNKMTLIEATPLISSTKYSKKLRETFYGNIDNVAVHEDWLQFESSALREKQNIMEGAGNRLRKFLRNEIIRNVIGVQSKNLDLLSIMNEGKILLVNLNGKDKISHENTKLLGVMLVNEIFRVAKLRDPRDQNLKPFYCYIDEFGQFVTRDIARALEECRKFKLFMVLAHQHLAQLKKEDEYLYASVMTNCKNKVVFGGLSVEDAEVMSEEISTGFLDLKKIKDEVYTTKVHHIEETRRVKSRQQSETNTITRSTTQGKTESFGETESLSKGKSSSKGHIVGSSESRSSSHSQSKGTIKTHSDQSSRSTPEGIFVDEENRILSTGIADGISESEIYSDGSSSGTSSSKSKSTSEGVSENRSKGTLKTEGTSKSETEGESKGKTTGEGESVVPFLRPEEYKELSSRTFWTKDELQYMEMADIKKQPSQDAYIKIGSNAPTKTRVDDVPSVFYSSRTSPKKIRQFEEKIYLEHKDYYTPIRDVKTEFQDRQKHFFGQSLDFHERNVFEQSGNTEKEPNQEKEDLGFEFE